MPAVRIGTFNCENLFLRYKFVGPSLKKKQGESQAAYEARVRRAREAARKEFEQRGVELDWLHREIERYDPISGKQRKATALVIRENNPDIMALVEVESMEALRKFNSAEFFGTKRFPYFMLIDGNDPRGIDVALLSRYPITHIRSYIHDTYKTPKGGTVETFSRDCLVARVDTGKTEITLFINHFKSKFMDNPERRKRQAKRVAEILEETFGKNVGTSRFVVLGDFNEIPTDPSLKPLLGHKALVDVLRRLPAQERWTHVYEKHGTVQRVSQLDYILLSPPLAKTVKGVPKIERRGLARYKKLNQYYPDAAPRFPSVDQPGTEASDHCAVFVDVEV
jgi:endonuclease/exonuclease/phosphatase family metal-dependent hydrolase